MTNQGNNESWPMKKDKKTKEYDTAQKQEKEMIRQEMNRKKNWLDKCAEIVQEAKEDK